MVKANKKNNIIEEISLGADELFSFSIANQSKLLKLIAS